MNDRSLIATSVIATLAGTSVTSAAFLVIYALGYRAGLEAANRDAVEKAVVELLDRSIRLGRMSDSLVHEINTMKVPKVIVRTCRPAPGVAC
jgi:hypothetical protein